MKDTMKKILLLIVIILIGLSINYIEDNFNILENNNNNEEINLRKDDAEPVIKEEKDYTFHIYYLDVGQADSILIDDNGKYSLIDAGNNEDGDKLVEYFKSLGIENFQYVIGTHAHEDHIGGMDDIINNFKIEHFYMPDVITTTKTFEEILDALENNNLAFETPEIDSTYTINKSKFKILYVGTEGEDLNDTSIVLKLQYDNTSYLFTGDSTTNVEKKIINKDLKSDVFKVSHHGSQYSNSTEFINKISPKYSIIQVGLNNTYNHPKDIVLERLEKVGSKIYRTDKDGTVIVDSDGVNIKIRTIKTDTNGGL